MRKRESRFKNIKLLIFDFDGTIVDTKRLYYKAISENLKKVGYEKLETNLIFHLGKRLPELLKDMKVEKKKIRKLKDMINKEIVESAREIKVCSGISALDDLERNYMMIIVSNSISRFVKRILKSMKISIFSRVVGGEGFVRKEDLFKRLFRQYKIKPREAVYIGDRAYDVKVARKAGCWSVILANKCSWNSLREIKKEKPDFIIRHFSELKRLVMH